MPAYAIANLTNVDLNDEVITYMRRIDATLEPYGGRFLVHGKVPDVMEGPWADTTVIIGFPDLPSAHAWYASPAYQEILALRTQNSDGQTVIIEGVGEDYRATDFLAARGL
jgi:uncharacterized protein (DUF1330 family)